MILIFYWLLLRPRVSELQLVSHSFGKFRVALQTNAQMARWRAIFLAAHSPRARVSARAETTLTVWDRARRQAGKYAITGA